jgi:hypothetical protein
MPVVRGVEEKRRNELTLHARLGRRDKANWRSRASSGRKGLSAHWFLQVSAATEWHGARCASVALRAFLMHFNLPGDGNRNVRR